MEAPWSSVGTDLPFSPTMVMFKIIDSVTSNLFKIQNYNTYSVEVDTEKWIARKKCM